MANKLAPVGIARACSRFDGESPHWLGMGMEIPDLFNWVLSQPKSRRDDEPKK